MNITESKQSAEQVSQTPKTFFERCPDESCPLYYMWALLIIVTSIRVWALSFYPGELFYDEAQYVSWAQDLAFGYYSKPPLVAWLIALSQQICGTGEACVRLSSPILHAVTSLFIFGAARSIYKDDGGKTALAAGAMYITLPGVSLSSGIISVDPIFLCCWAGALYCFVRAVEDPYRLRYWIGCGIFGGLGMLSKYTMVLFGAGAFLYVLTTPHRRYILTLKGFWLAAIIGAVIFLPNILWNVNNDFVSVRHTKDNAAFHLANLSLDEFFEFFGAQFGVFGPIFFAALLTGLCCRCRVRSDTSGYGALLIWQILPILFVISAIALMSRAHANWAAPAYIAASIYVARFLISAPFRMWFVAGMILHVIAGALMTFPRHAPGMFGLSYGPHTSIAEGIIKDPFIRVDVGNALGNHVEKYKNEVRADTVLTSDRATHALLTYYTDIAHDSIKAWNPKGKISHHYELYASIKEPDPSRIYLAVTKRPADTLDMTHVFKDIDLVDTFHIGKYDGRKQLYYVYRLTGTLLQ